MIDQTVIHVIQLKATIPQALEMIGEATRSEAYIKDSFEGRRFLVKTFIDDSPFYLEVEVDGNGRVNRVSWERQVIKHEIYYEEEWMRDDDSGIVKSTFSGQNYPLGGEGES